MNKITLVPVKLDSEYSKKWNERLTDFQHLYINGIKKSDTLYRGGFGIELDEPYLLLIKHVEAYYNDDITITDKEHLEGQWCIIDNNGVEVVNFKHFDSPYLLGGQIYSLNNSYYNITTGYEYSKNVYSSISSKNYLFIDDSYNKDKSKRGIIKIHKKTGSFELIQ